MSVANSGIFVEYGAYFATAVSQKYMQNNTLFVGCIDFFSIFAFAYHIQYRRSPVYLGV